MTHEQALNQILSYAPNNKCRDTYYSDKGYKEYTIELPDVKIIVVAKCLSMPDYDTQSVPEEFQYDILDVW